MPCPNITPVLFLKCFIMDSTMKLDQCELSICDERIQKRQKTSFLHSIPLHGAAAVLLPLPPRALRQVMHRMQRGTPKVRQSEAKV